MNSKIIIQILLIVTAITILSATFYYYFYEKPITSIVPKSDNLNKKLINNTSDTDLE
jgi:peptidoglycan/LPS O-acetylase OafA/YrhL